MRSSECRSERATWSPLRSLSTSESRPCTVLRVTSARACRWLRKICSPISHRDFFATACITYVRSR